MYMSMHIVFEISHLQDLNTGWDEAVDSDWSDNTGEKKGNW